MEAKLSRHPYNRATFRYTPNDPYGTGGYTLNYVGEVSEEWIINNVPNGSTSFNVATGSGLPQPGTANADDANWIVARIENLTDTPDVNKQNGTNTWRCTIVYVPDPLQMAPEIAFATNRVMQTITNDQVTGEAVVNSRGDPFNPEVQEARSMLRVRVIKRYSVAGLTALNPLQYVDHCNDSDWPVPIIGIVGGVRAYCLGVETPLVKEPYWHYQAEFHFDIEDPSGTFHSKLLDCGYQYNTGTNDPHLFAAGDGTEHGNIGLLDGAGGKGDPASPTYLTFNTKPVIDFNALNLFA